MPGAGQGPSVSLYVLTNVNAANAGLVASPLTNYGTIGVNDSGGWCGEAQRFKVSSIQLEQVGTTALTGFAVSIYACTTPAAWQTWYNAFRGPGAHFGSGGAYGSGGVHIYNGPTAVNLPAQGFTNAAGYVPGVPPASWILLPGPSEQGGTGMSANPLTPTTPFLSASTPIIAIRAVITANASSAGIFNVSVTITK